MVHNYSNHVGMRLVRLALAAVPLFVPSRGFSQSGYPGVWKRINLPQFQLILDFGFADTLNGVFYSGNGAMGYTTDGGMTWSSAGATLITSKPCIGMVSCTGPKKAIIAVTGCDQVELDGNSVFTDTCVGVGPEFDNYTTLAQKMYDTSYGFRFVQVVDRSGTPLDTARIEVTHDGWNSYQSFGDSLAGNQLANRGLGSEIDGATLVDSNEVWLGVNNTIYRTTNAGSTWDIIQPQAGTADSNLNPEWYNFIVNPETKEVYAKAALPPIDYAYSSDNGKTWEIDSAFKGHMSRLSVPSPHKLWAMIGRHTFANPPINLESEDPFVSYFTKVLAYSSDNGASWSLDSTTFASDSEMLEMHWIDSSHGWIASFVAYSGPSGMWYYDANGNAGVEVSIVGFKAQQYQVYPDPASSFINTNPLSDNLTVFDPLGREYFVRSSNGSIDISGLSPGIYFIADNGIVRGRFVKE